MVNSSCGILSARIHSTIVKYSSVYFALLSLLICLIGNEQTFNNDNNNVVLVLESRAQDQDQD